MTDETQTTTHVLPQHLPNVRESWGGWIIAFTFGFLGGVLPSAIKLASIFAAATYVAGEFDPPRYTFYVGMAIYGLVGAIVSLALRQFATREAFIAGILAPSLVTNVIGGVSEGAVKQPIRAGALQSGLLQYVALFSTTANAQEAPSKQPSSESSNDEIIYAGTDTVTWGNPKGKKNDIIFIFNVTRNDIVVAKVKIDFFFDKMAPAKSKTIYVSPTFNGTIAVPEEYKCVRVDNSLPLNIPSGPSVIVINGDVRTSRGFDFLWALGGIREYKMTDVKVKFSPLSQSKDSDNDCASAQFAK